MSIGKDNLPKSITASSILSSIDLQRLADHGHVPDPKDVDDFAKEPEVSSIIEFFSDNPDGMQEELHKLAKTYLEDNDLEKAWKALMLV